MKSEPMNLNEVDTEDLVAMLRHVSVETGSLACLGCGHEHNCGTRGCALIRAAADRLDASRAPTLTPPNEALTLEQLREMKDKPAYLNFFDPLLESGWHIIKAVTEDKIIFRGWQTVYVPIDGMGIDYNLYRRPPEGEEDT